MQNSFGHSIYKNTLNIPNINILCRFFLYILPRVLDLSLDAMLLLDFSLPTELNRKQHPTCQYPRQQIVGSTKIHFKVKLLRLHFVFDLRKIVKTRSIKNTFIILTDLCFFKLSIDIPGITILNLLLFWSFKKILRYNKYWTQWNKLGLEKR